MDILNRYRQLIQKILTEYTQTPYAYGDIQFETVFDRESDRYLVMILGREKVRRVYGCLIHLDIIDGKIWIQRDGTEDGIANELLTAGVSKEHIVLGFQSPERRKLTELTVIEEARGAYLLREDTNSIDSRWDDLFTDSWSEDVFSALANEARATDETDLWSLEESGL